MTNSTAHPPIAELVAVAEGKQVTNRHAVLDHAAQCEGCGALLIALAAQPESSATPIPVLRRTRRRIAAPLLLAAASLAVVAVGVFNSRPVSATTAVGSLHFTPARPLPGDSVRVSFRGGLLAGQPRLRLRAEIRDGDVDYPEWALPKRVVAQLTRREDGSYAGAFVFPANASYAVFAVEDSVGDAVDANGGRLWELLAHDSTRTRPTIDALQQKAHLFYERDRALSRRAAQQLVQFYPDAPEARSLALWYEEELAGPAGRDSVKKLELPAYRRLEQRLRAQQNLSERTASKMLSYAESMSDSLGTAYWAARVEREFPDAMLLTINRMFKQMQRAGTATARLQVLESLWESDVKARQSIALQGFIIASQQRQAADLERWGNRLLAYGPSGYFESVVAYSYVGVPVLAARGASMMRAQLARFGVNSDSTRTIGRTRVQAQPQHALALSSRLTSLAEALMSLGQTSAAVDTLERATSLAWRGDTYRKLSNAKLAVRDTVGAARAAAFALTDPSLPASVRGELQQQFAAFEARNEWSAWQRAAADTMRAKLLTREVRRALPGRVRLVSTEGAEVDIQSLTGKGPTVFAFWSRWCGGSLTELPELQRVSTELARMGVRLVAVTTDPINADLTKWMRTMGYTFPVYQDRRGEAGAAFQPYGTPDHILVDKSGAVRFERLRAKELPTFGKLLLQ